MSVMPHPPPGPPPERKTPNQLRISALSSELTPLMTPRTPKSSVDQDLRSSFDKGWNRLAGFSPRTAESPAASRLFRQLVYVKASRTSAPSTPRSHFSTRPTTAPSRLSPSHSNTQKSLDDTIRKFLEDVDKDTKLRRKKTDYNNIFFMSVRGDYPVFRLNGFQISKFGIESVPKGFTIPLSDVSIHKLEVVAPFSRAGSVPAFTCVDRQNNSHLILKRFDLTDYEMRRLLVNELESLMDNATPCLIRIRAAYLDEMHINLIFDNVDGGSAAQLVLDQYPLPTHGLTEQRPLARTGTRRRPDAAPPRRLLPPPQRPPSQRHWEPLSLDWPRQLRQISKFWFLNGSQRPASASFQRVVQVHGP
jgi:hypothetical protein